MWRRAFEQPMPGVWEVVVARDRDVYTTDWRGTTPVPRGEYELTARVVGAAAVRDSSGAWRVENRFAPIDGRIRSRRAWTRGEKLTLSGASSQRVMEVDVTAAAEDLIVRSAVGTKRGQPEHVVVHSPTPGKWKVVVDGRGAVGYRQTITGGGPTEVVDVVAEGIDDYAAKPKAGAPVGIAPLRSELDVVRWPVSVSVRHARAKP